MEEFPTKFIWEKKEIPGLLLTNKATFCSHGFPERRNCQRIGHTSRDLRVLLPHWLTVFFIISNSVYCCCASVGRKMAHPLINE